MHVGDIPVAIVVFGMHGCPACEEYLPTFREVAEPWQPIVPSWAFDSNQFGAAADFYAVRETPTTLVLKHGREAKRFVGPGSRADIEKLFRWASEGAR